jgi:hypothetical protein
MEKLKRLSQNGFQECFQYLCSRQQRFIVTQGVYFEGNVALMILLLFMHSVMMKLYGLKHIGVSWF